MIKKLLTLMILGFATTANAESLANDILQRDTINGIGGIKMILGVKGYECQPKLLEAEVLQQPTDIKLYQGVAVSGYWREFWTLQCNDSKVTVPIKFVLDKTGASWVITLDEVEIK